MAKTILIASIIAGIAIMLLFSAQQAYAPSPTPKGAVAFSFSDGDTPRIDMSGQGAWKKGGQIGAGGSFAATSTSGNWHATKLITVMCCPPGGPTSTGMGIVVFEAAFSDGSTHKVVVAINTKDIDGNAFNGVQNFWVSGGGFGNADVSMRPAP
ncbi:MAG: hypothetical protein IIA81_01835 [Thaumarchaeota archaeon]|nr:hypothetical protein [Nitrososphaerota archaeon]